MLKTKSQNMLRKVNKRSLIYSLKNGNGGSLVPRSSLLMDKRSAVRAEEAASCGGSRGGGFLKQVLKKCYEKSRETSPCLLFENDEYLFIYFSTFQKNKTIAHHP